MRFTSVLMALAIVGGLYYWFALRGQMPPSGPPEASATLAVTAPATSSAADAPVPVVVFESTARETVNQIILRGRTSANRRVSVAAETAGLVISQPIRRGSEVAEGDLLCRLDPGARPAQLLEAEAALAEARVEAEAATQLSQKGFATETTRIARQAQLEAAQAAVDLVRLDIARLEIRAPFSGILETDTAELGSRLAPGDGCAVVIDLSSVKVSGFVSEQEVDQIQLGQTATARLINGRRIAGRISFISPVADPETRTFQVEVTLPNSDSRIRDGMTAELSIDLPAQVAHRIPQTALTLDDDGRLGVRLAEDGVARFAPVSIIRDETDGVWVSGLTDRASVIVVGQEFVRDGRAIAPSPAQAPVTQ